MHTHKYTSTNTRAYTFIHIPCNYIHATIPTNNSLHTRYCVWFPCRINNTTSKKEQKYHAYSIKLVTFHIISIILLLAATNQTKILIKILLTSHRNRCIAMDFSFSFIHTYAVRAVFMNCECFCIIYIVSRLYGRARVWLCVCVWLAYRKNYINRIDCLHFSFPHVSLSPSDSIALDLM